MAQARLRQIPVTRRNRPALRGRLDEFGLATVLGFLDLERRSGEILIVGGDRVGHVWVRGGQVISARVEGSRLVNRAAIDELLAWNEGSFTFTQEELTSATDEIGVPTALLLVAAALRTDEAAMPAGY
jgi:hypothetical protein